MKMMMMMMMMMIIIIMFYRYFGAQPVVVLVRVGYILGPLTVGRSESTLP